MTFPLSQFGAGDRRSCTEQAYQRFASQLGNFSFVQPFYITSAQLLALNATPVTILAAPGAGRAIIIDRAVLFYDYDGLSTPYVVDSTTSDFVLRYTDGSGSILCQCAATGFVTELNDESRIAYPFRAASGDSDVEPTANAAVVLHMTTAEITTGTSPLKLEVTYRIVKTDLSYIPTTQTVT